MKLLTVDGYKYFKELDGSNVELINVNGNVTKGKVWCSGEKDTINLKLSDNSVIKCTPNHMFMTVGGNECMAKDLKGKKLMPLITYNNNKLDKDYIKLGFIQGDGSLSRLKSDAHKGLEVHIGCKDGDIHDLFSDETFNDVSERTIYLSGYNDKLRDLVFSEEVLPNRELPKTYDSWTKKPKSKFSTRVLFCKWQCSYKCKS